ncbi:unnamed protein product [Tilletia controversa]|uniref:DUF202 domain-containing protein n=3 Tax=Tilletia TaxID=13289 RepID=A0A8X7T010_9BASI|nr:hypothetical protein CF336_g1147 [Tilletia laevis]KAE8203419.1 hypothetical protein CF328_g1669 [Tilletia controversa]KAE8264627.1 hypothetical protein A4X03_0g813 [Tilletia caries]KAE8207502.1 hypothetical protein CF335_g1094 [Tilletia laevis]KAE8253828.1 hypothetical protein A4X06_0g1198 [Tilletia controversa]
MSSSSAAADHLAHPSERGTLQLAFRRSVVALQSVFGGGHADSEAHRAEREPLLEGNGNSALGAEQGYGSVLDLPPERRVPKPKAVISPLRVEAKVWFANERTWISWLRVSVLIGSFALALLNSSSFFEHHKLPDNPIDEPGPAFPPKNPQGLGPGTIKAFGFLYAVIALATLSWGLFSYQRRVTLIKAKYGGHLDDLWGPPLICAALFVAVLLNFIVRVQQFNLESAAP